MNLHYRRLNEQISKIKLDIEYDARKQATERNIPVDETLYAKEVDNIKIHYANKIKLLEQELAVVEDKLFVMENRLYIFHDEPLPETLEEVRRLYMERLPDNYSDELLDAFDITLQSEGILPRVEELEIGQDHKLKVLEKRRARGSSESVAYLEETIRLEAMEIVILLERHEKLVHIANQTFASHKELYSYAKELSQEILEVGEYLNAKKYSEELNHARTDLESEILKCKTKRKAQLERTDSNPPLREPEFTFFKNNNHPFTSTGRELYAKLAQLEGKVNSTEEAIASLENLEENIVQQKKIVRAWSTPPNNRIIERAPSVKMTKMTNNRLRTGLNVAPFEMKKTTKIDARSKIRNNIQENIKPKTTVKRGLPPRPVTKSIEPPKANRLPSMPSLPTPSTLLNERKPNERNLPLMPKDSNQGKEYPHNAPQSTPSRTNGLPVAPNRANGLPVAPNRTNGLPVAPNRTNGLPVAPSKTNGLPVAPSKTNGLPALALPTAPHRNNQQNIPTMPHSPMVKESDESSVSGGKNYSLPSVSQMINAPTNRGLPTAPDKSVEAQSNASQRHETSTPQNENVLDQRTENPSSRALPATPAGSRFPAKPSKDLEIQNYSKPLQGKQSRVRKPLPQKPQEPRVAPNNNSSDNLPVLPSKPRTAENKAPMNRASGTIRGMRVARNRYR